MMVGYLSSVIRSSVSTFDELFPRKKLTDLNHFSPVACLWCGIDNRVTMGKCISITPLVFVGSS